MTRLVDVALPVPLAHAFTYTLPDALIQRAVPGARVVVPFGNRRAIGVVVDVKDGDPPPNAKAILDALDDEPALPPDLLAFLRDVSQYYLAPIGEVIKLSLPPEDRKSANATAKPSLFADKKGLSARTVQWVIPLAGDGSVQLDKPLSGQAHAVLAFVRASGEAALAKLQLQWKSARVAVKKLEALGLVKIEDREAPRDAFFDDAIDRDVAPEATAPQREAMDAIAAALEKEEGSATFLLHGVTGSGKTEVYLDAIDRARARKKGSIVLVPEIALTPQLVSRYRARFGDDVAVVHSGLTPRERYDTWMRLRKGEFDVAIGARSALFTPVKNVGLVIVDEEHDPSFKQEEGVRYHARDMAILRAHRAHGVCVLGSATPSLESEHLTRTGRAKKLFLPERARGQAMPTVEVIDLRRIGAGPTGDKRLSIPLHRAIEKTLAAKEQTILFLNRRGFSPSVRCESCGEIAACPSCSVALTFHKKGLFDLRENVPRESRGHGAVRCHYCDYQAELPKVCGKCGKPSLILEGLGTEKLEETLQKAFPTARIARLDRDVASGKNVEKIIARVRNREVDILVGTQMVTKGHDLPHVTLVGVINADAALSIPDFRASERAFHLLVQVAGRAGRGDKAGKVLIQTYDPDHPAIAYARQHDVLGFLERELVDRKELAYPPFSRAALVRVDALHEHEAREIAENLAAIARDAASKETCKVHVLGPAPAPLARLRARYRFRVMVRSEDRQSLRRVLLAVERARGTFARSVRTGIDVDPVQLL